MHSSATFLIEFGAIILALGLLGRFAARFQFSPIPLYLLAGLAFGEGGLLPLGTSEEFVAIGAEIGVILLLLMLGLEYSASDLVSNLKTQYTGSRRRRPQRAARAPPWRCCSAGDRSPRWCWPGSPGSPPPVSSPRSSATWAGSATARPRHPQRPGPGRPLHGRLPADHHRPAGRHGPRGGQPHPGRRARRRGTRPAVAVRYGRHISRFVSSDDPEKLLLVVLGLTLLVAGLAQQLQVSAAVGAFLVGIALSGEAAEGAHNLLSPLRDLFAAVFFVFFGLHTDPASIPPVLLPALALAVVTAGTKIATGYWAARRAGSPRRAAGGRAARWSPGASSPSSSPDSPSPPASNPPSAPWPRRTC
jgi:CPA2 family monovalent cation:H+ antiporter-2